MKTNKYEVKAKNTKTVWNALNSFLNSWLAILIGNALLIGLFILLAWAFNPTQSFKELCAGIFANGVAISVLLVEFVTWGGRRISKKSRDRMEESNKTTDDHHGIILQYSGHSKKDIPTDKNYFSKDGAYLSLTKVLVPAAFEKIDASAVISNQALEEIHKDYSKHIKHGLLRSAIKAEDGLSKSYGKVMDAIETYVREKKLYLPSVNLFTNIEGNVKIRFDDSAMEYPLPEFIQTHSGDLMDAHSGMSSDNKDTIRLNDLSYDSASGELVMSTSRTNYYKMLLTNRCMDFEFNNGMTLRDIYEYRDKVLPLNETELGNQIGIEGLILSNDGWTLIEKRSNAARTTWLDKFSMPISLSMGKSGMKNDSGSLGLHDLMVNADGQATNEDAAIRIKNLIASHVKSNYALVEGKDYHFDVTKNFMGIARDLLEGGKPNMYFYIITNCDHKELKKRLEERSYTDTSLSSGNLQRKYYLYPIEELSVDFNYRMGLDLLHDDGLKAGNPEKRIFRGRSNMALDGIGEVSSENQVGKLRNTSAARSQIEKEQKALRYAKKHYKRKVRRYPFYKKECGEAFLGCIAYYYLCRDRIIKEMEALK